MSKAQKTRRSRRLNRRALVLLGVTAVVLTVAFVALKHHRAMRAGSAYLAEAKERIAQKQWNLAIGYLNRYLDLHPDDPEALRLKAEILADSANSFAQGQEAVKYYSRVVEQAPRGPERIKARKRLVQLILKMGSVDWFPQAENQAAKLVDPKEDNADDAESHRLMAEALQYNAYFSDKSPAKYNLAASEYAKAAAKAPTDVAIAEQFSALYRERMENPAEAEKILNALVEKVGADPAQEAAARLARFRHYYQIARAATTPPDEAKRAANLAEADVVAAVKLAPNNIDARLAAAAFALEWPRLDAVDARHHLAAIPAEQRQSLKVKYLEGMLGLVERNPNEAVNAWRSGLLLTGGTDENLTAGLAQVLLDSGRHSEARPLIEQYRRLTGGDLVDPRYREAHEARDAKYHFLQGLSLLRDNQPAEAIRELDLVKYKDIKNRETGQDQQNVLFYTLGQAYEAIREPQKAIEAYRRAAEAPGETPLAWTALARLQAQQTGKTTESEATLRRGLSLLRNDPKLVTALADLLWRQQMLKPAAKRDWTEVEKQIETARRAAPASIELALLKANFYAARNQHEDAIELLHMATQQNPHAAELWLELTKLLARRGRVGEALETLDKAEAPAAAGPHAALAMTRASLLLLKAQVSEARKTLTDALEKVPAPEKPALWKSLGDFYQSQKDLTSARAAYDEWVRLAPKDPEPRLVLFQLVFKNGGDEEAINRAAEDLKKVSPDSYHWRWARAEALLRTRPGETPDAERDAKRQEEAKSLVAQIQEIAPQIALGYVMAGHLNEARKNLPAAIDAYKKALEHNGGNEALEPLIALLVREKREGELKTLPQLNPDDVEKLAAVQALRSGDKTRAEQLANLAVKGDPAGFDIRLWQAEVLKALGKPDAAEDALRAATRQRPADQSAWLALLMLQLSRHKGADAAATVEQIRDKVQAENKELLLAHCYKALGNFPKAEESFRAAFRKAPNDANVQASAIAFYEQTGRADEAVASLRTLCRQQPTNSWATRKLATALATRKGNRASWDEALALIKPDPQPNDLPDDLITRAAVYGEGPEPQHRAKAIAILEKLLAEVPNLPRIHEQLARLQFASGDLKNARVHAAKAVEGNAGADAIAYYAGVLLATEDVNEAEVQLKRLQALDPESLQSVEVNARVLAARGKGDEAAALLEKAYLARAATPEGAGIATTIIGMLSTPPLKNLETAERVARKFAEVSPRAHCYLAEILAARGKPVEAAAELQTAAKAGETVAAGTIAVNLASRDLSDQRWVKLADKILSADSDTANAPPELLLQIALVRHLKGDFKGEVAAYQRLLASKPDNFTFLNNMAWTLSEDLKQPEDGLKWIEEAIKKAGPIPQLLDTRGVILTRLGKCDAAVKDLEQASQKLVDPSVEYHLARAYQKLGKDENARKHSGRARAAGLKPEQLQPCDRIDWETVMK